MWYDIYENNNSMTSGLVYMLTLMVGEILSIFPSSKASGARMGFLNQSTFPWMNYFASTEYWYDDEEGSSGMKQER